MRSNTYDYYRYYVLTQMLYVNQTFNKYTPKPEPYYNVAHDQEDSCDSQNQ